MLVAIYSKYQHTLVHSYKTQNGRKIGHKSREFWHWQQAHKAPWQFEQNCVFSLPDMPFKKPCMQNNNCCFPITLLTPNTQTSDHKTTPAKHLWPRTRNSTSNLIYWGATIWLKGEKMPTRQHPRRHLYAGIPVVMWLFLVSIVVANSSLAFGIGILFIELHVKRKSRLHNLKKLIAMVITLFFSNCWRLS